jgi:hypothetical protein
LTSISSIIDRKHILHMFMREEVFDIYLDVGIARSSYPFPCQAGLYIFIFF